MKLKEKREFLLSILTPLRELLDAEKCTAWLAGELHAGSPPVCPSCREIPTGSTADLLQEGRRIRCQMCGKGWNIWTGTLFEGAKITTVDFVLIRVGLAAELDFTGLMELTGRHGQAVKAWTRKVQAFNAMKGEPTDGSSHC